MQEHLPRASKIQDWTTVTGMVDHNTRPSGLKIRIPKSAWNAYEPPPQPRPKLTLRLKVAGQQPIETTEHTSDEPRHGYDTPSPLAHPTNCKVKIWQFRYGGPARRTKGKSQNEITLEAPCLQPTCANCSKWYPHLMGDQALPDEYTEQHIVSHAQSVEPISPDIDPRLLDGTWQEYQDNRPGSATSSAGSETNHTPALTPVEKSFSNDVPPPDPNLHSYHVYPSPTSTLPPWNILLPTSLVDQTVNTASAHSTWRSEPRRRYIARLAFASHEGKRKFEDLVRKREKKLKKQEYDRAYRARIKAEKEREKMGRLQGGE